ncbi:MAG: hypothetical protein WBZ20_00515, partial [Nitrososphaeraceae archaeon]
MKEGTSPDDDIVPIGMFRFFPWWKPWSKDIPTWAPHVKQTTICCSQDKGTTNTNDLATEEASRRYYCTKEFVLKGKKVFSVK